MFKQLQDVDIYEDTDFKASDLVKLVEKTNTLFQSIKKNNLVTEKELKYFPYQYKNSTNFGKMYLIPKIHNRLDNVADCPVISNFGTPAEKASGFLDHHLQPILKSGVSYIKCTNDFLFKLKNLRKIPENAFLVTSDVVGLYPNIPHDEGLEVSRKQCNALDNKSISTEDLVKMAEFVLKNNYFEFNSSCKHQILGTAIGTKFAPPYACIFMDYIEREFLKNEEIQPWIWFRYIDDIFFIWTASEKEFDEFLNRLNSFHPNLRFTHERSRESLNFLDVVVKIQQGEFVTDLYYKPTDRHQYLHFDSCHASHTKTSIVYSQALRMKRICSRRSDLIVNINKLKDWFRERGYPEEIVNKETKRALESSIGSFNNRSKKITQDDRQKGIPLVVTYNPFLCHLGQTIRKNLFLLYQDEEVIFFLFLFALLGPLKPT